MVKIFRIMIAMMLPMALASCTLMHDDLPACEDVPDEGVELESGLDIKFVYDYNIQRADLFGAHVGAVRVYIYDRDGGFVTAREESKENENKLDSVGYRMHFDLPVGFYRVVAVGEQGATDRLASVEGARFRIPRLSNIGTINDFQVRLDRDETTGEVVHAGLPLDTLWIGNIDDPIEVKDHERTEATVNLMRNTKRILLSLHDLDTPETISTEDYDVSIVCDNGLALYDNTHPADQELLYTPYAIWSTDWGGTSETAAAARYEIMTGRLLLYDESREARTNAKLRIVNKNTGAVIANLDLPNILQQGRGAYERYNYTAQEYLDREYSYTLDFFIKGDRWIYANLTVDVLAWTKHIMNYAL